MELIQCTGVDELDEQEKVIVNKLANEYYQKYVRTLNNVTSLQIHIKTYNDDGKQRKFSIHAGSVGCESAGVALGACEASGLVSEDTLALFAFSVPSPHFLRQRRRKSKITYQHQKSYKKMKYILSFFKGDRTRRRP